MSKEIAHLRGHARLYTFLRKERINGLALGAWIRRQRLFRNMTQSEVAARAGKLQGQVAKLETGQTSTVAKEDVAAWARGVMATELAALKAIGYRESGAPLEDLSAEEEEAQALAESYRGYTSPEAREILRKALQYADAVEASAVIGGRVPGVSEQN